jgi:hypothetical protein
MLTLPTSFPATRLAAHTVAEHVVCAVRYATVGRIGLTPVEDGYVTPEFSRPEGGSRVVGLRGGELVDVVDGIERRAPATTVRGAAEFLGVPPGAPPLWTPTTPLELDAPLAIAPEALAALAGWFMLGAQALSSLAPAAEQTLWPEHFDLAITLDGATYGVSPGDAEVAEPYAYVGPPEDPAPDGDRSFWNARFGAARSHEQIATAADLIAFYAEARRRL